MSGRSCKYGVLALGVRARSGECGAVAGETPPHLDAWATNPGNSLDTRGGMPKKRGSAPPPARSSLAVSPGTSVSPRPRASCCRHAPLPASGGACARACLARPRHGLQEAAAGHPSCWGSSGQRCAGVEASGPSALQGLACQTCSPGGGIVKSQLHARIVLGPCRSTGGGKSGGSRWSSGSPTVASAMSGRPRPSGLQVGVRWWGVALPGWFAYRGWGHRQKREESGRAAGALGPGAPVSRCRPGRSPRRTSRDTGVARGVEPNATVVVDKRERGGKQCPKCHLPAICARQRARLTPARFKLPPPCGSGQRGVGPGQLQTQVPASGALALPPLVRVASKRGEGLGSCAAQCAGSRVSSRLPVWQVPPIWRVRRARPAGETGGAGTEEA